MNEKNVIRIEGVKYAGDYTLRLRWANDKVLTVGERRTVECGPLATVLVAFSAFVPGVLTIVAVVVAVVVALARLRDDAPCGKCDQRREHAAFDYAM